MGAALSREIVHLPAQIWQQWHTHIATGQPYSRLLSLEASGKPRVRPWRHYDYTSCAMDVSSQGESANLGASSDDANTFCWSQIGSPAKAVEVWLYGGIAVAKGGTVFE